jgi:hypothetical protein
VGDGVRSLESSGYTTGGVSHYYTGILCLGSKMINPIILFAISFTGFLIYASFFEWTVHRYAMHRPVPLIHTQFFFKGHTFDHHLVGDRPHNDLTLGWSAAVPTLLHTPVLIALAVWLSVPVSAGMLGAFVFYGFFYEYLHYSMHVPKDRWFESTGVFKWLNRHHLQHHRKHNSNLNVLLPFADYIMQTRRTLSGVLLWSGKRQ